MKIKRRIYAIILMLAGLIAMVAFIALVIDISVMFIRYSTLNRLADTVTVAAAEQIQQGRDSGAIALAVRQYIVSHGLDATAVQVDNCTALINEKSLCDKKNPHNQVQVQVQIRSETVFLRYLGMETVTLTVSSISDSGIATRR